MPATSRTSSPTQQSYAKVAGVTETIKVTELVEDALRVNMEPWRAMMCG